jgi:hypothetical protein
LAELFSQLTLQLQYFQMDKVQLSCEIFKESSLFAFCQSILLEMAQDAVASVDQPDFPDSYHEYFIDVERLFLLIQLQGGCELRCERDLSGGEVGYSGSNARRDIFWLIKSVRRSGVAA